VFVSIFKLRNEKQEKAVRRSSLTISEALAAARQAGKQTGDTGLFSEWLRVKGLSTRGNILVSRMQREYEAGFEERFKNGERGILVGVSCGPSSGRVSVCRCDTAPQIVVAPADPRKLNRLFLERQQGGDATCSKTMGHNNAARPAANSITGMSVAPVFVASDAAPVSTKAGAVVPSSDAISALYASGKASSLKEALAIIGGHK